MHLNVVEHRHDLADSGWPKRAGQLGSTVITLLVDDLDFEIQRLRSEGAPLLGDPVTTVRLLGPTRSAYTQDPDGNLLELLEALRDRVGPTLTARSWEPRELFFISS
jgi:catechol 2,3-dioxygenase-like lactoylglutathione lyase family enzyme